MSASGDYSQSDVYKSPMPGAGGYSQYAATQQQAYASATQQVQDARTSMLTQQGLSGVEYNPDGSVKSTTIDANSPAGAYQQMTKGNALQGNADDAAIGAMGFGGGLATQQHEAAQQGYSKNAADWATNMLGNFGAEGKQDVANTGALNTNLMSGLVSDISGAIAAGSFNPANYSGISIGGQTVDVGQLGKALTPPKPVTPPPTIGGGTGPAHNAGTRETAYGHWDAKGNWVSGGGAAGEVVNGKFVKGAH